MSLDCKNEILLHYCRYSFGDLLKAAGRPHDTTDLYALSQILRNEEVKILCAEANWYWSDMIGMDKEIYTAFSPLKKSKN